MTILPLIERELRVRSRRRAVYWTRFAFALAGILICLPTLVMSWGPYGGSQAVLGQYAFNGLIVTAFFLSCCAGLLTADSISRERREGTLGLLFLTRVKAFDVLLGTFGSAGITCVCALIACVPVLILPVLTGGVTGGEACRKVLVLFDALFLSITAGLWASARGRGWFKSALATVLLLVCLLVVPPLIALLGGTLFGFDVALLSPLSALHYADDVWHRTYSARYWISIAAVHGISWLLLLSAAVRLRRAMREEDGTQESSTTADLENTALPRRTHAPIEDGKDPVAWLLRRQRGIVPAIWAAALVGAIYSGGSRYLLMWFRMGFIAYSSWGLSMAVSSVGASLFGWAASRFFIEARRTGKLELLLTTPLGAERIISSQWNWLKRLLFWPIVVLIIPRMADTAWLRLVTGPPASGSMGWVPLILFSLSLSCCNIIIGTGAMIWLGFWFGLKARSQASAILRIVILAKGAPWLITVLGSLLFTLGRRYYIGQSTAIYWIIWAPPTAILLYFLWLIRWARRRLQTELAHDGPAPLSLSQSIATFVRKIRRWPHDS